MKEARYYKRQENSVLCQLCPKGCLIGQGKAGFCRVRKNKNGILYAENYGQCSGYALDPIEKKPLYHFYPGSTIFSIGTWGCNFACQFCQNWEIAQSAPHTADLSPADAVTAALRAGRGNIGIAYTYSEPSVWYEFIYDTARIARKQGLKNVLVTNGFINREPLSELLPFIDAMNIDVKAFTEEFYRDLCLGALEHVQRTVEQAVNHCHVEITTLIIPGMNDSDEEVSALSRWLAGLNKDIPLHLSRYFPRYKLQAPPTPLATLRRASEAAREHLRYVYIGNVGDDGVNTYCPECQALAVDRIHGRTGLDAAKKCKVCGQTIAIQGKISFPSA